MFVPDSTLDERDRAAIRARVHLALDELRTSDEAAIKTTVAARAQPKPPHPKPDTPAWREVEDLKRQARRRVEASERRRAEASELLRRWRSVPRVRQSAYVLGLLGDEHATVDELRARLSRAIRSEVPTADIEGLVEHMVRHGLLRGSSTHGPERYARSSRSVVLDAAEKV